MRTYDVRRRQVRTAKRRALVAERHAEEARRREAQANTLARSEHLHRLGLEARAKALAFPLNIEAGTMLTYAVSPHVLYSPLSGIPQREAWAYIKRDIVRQVQRAIERQVSEAFAPLIQSSAGPRELAQALRGLIQVVVPYGGAGATTLDLEDIDLPGL